MEINLTLKGEIFYDEINNKYYIVDYIHHHNGTKAEFFNIREIPGEIVKNLLISIKEYQPTAKGIIYGNSGLTTKKVTNILQNSNDI